MAKEIIAKEEMEQETTEQVEETKKKGLPSWAKFGLTFLGGAAASAILIGLFGGGAEDEDGEVINLSDKEYTVRDSSDADSDE